jgi:hypothetical protein
MPDTRDMPHSHEAQVSGAEQPVAQTLHHQETKPLFLKYNLKHVE